MKTEDHALLISQLRWPLTACAAGTQKEEMAKTVALCKQAADELQRITKDRVQAGWLDEEGRVVRLSNFGDGGFVDAGRAVPDSWRPVYL